MYITYDEYTALGYNDVQEVVFARYEAVAEAIADRYTQYRLSAETLTEANKRGICELISVAMEDAETGGRDVASFSNGRYSESYTSSRGGETGPSTSERRIETIIANFFTPAQRWRGIDKPEAPK